MRLLLQVLQDGLRLDCVLSDGKDEGHEAREGSSEK
jgi:hypothetical protein